MYAMLLCAMHVRLLDGQPDCGSKCQVCMHLHTAGERHLQCVFRGEMHIACRLMIALVFAICSRHHKAEHQLYSLWPV